MDIKLIISCPNHDGYSDSGRQAAHDLSVVTGLQRRSNLLHNDDLWCDVGCGWREESPQSTKVIADQSLYNLWWCITCAYSKAKTGAMNIDHNSWTYPWQWTIKLLAACFLILDWHATSECDIVMSHVSCRDITQDIVFYDGPDLSHSVLICHSLIILVCFHQSLVMIITPPESDHDQHSSSATDAQCSRK